MATKNITKKIAALSELRKDPATTIERAWLLIRSDLAAQPADALETHESDVDIIGQIIGAVVADIIADKKGGAS